MVSLLVLSLALSGPAAATQTAAVAHDPVTAQPSSSAQLQQADPQIVFEEPPQSFDPITGQPDGAICYKIRTYLFTKGSNPRLIRETTCGPNRPSARQVDRVQPKLVPLDVKDRSADSPRK